MVNSSEYTIIGGGVAGLCACMRLLELGIYPLVIESGKYPSPKVCGEFFSPRGVQILKQWGIQTIEIADAYFHAEGEVFHYPFPQTCGSLSHLVLDPLLVQKSKGAHFLIETKVNSIEPSADGHLLKLSSGDVIKTSNLILATGRMPNSVSPKFIYKGFQTHVKGNFRKNALEMFLFEEGYLGISPVEEEKYNIACLVDLSALGKWGGVTQLLDHWKSQDETFAGRFSISALNWLEALIPSFGRKIVPKWPHAYFIGDAARTIPPITGNGLTLGMESGIAAANYSSHRDYRGYLKASQKDYSAPIFFGKMLHSLAMKPKVANRLMKWGKHYAMNIFYYLTR